MNSFWKLVLLTSFFASPQAAQAADQLATSLWRSSDGRITVKVEPCYSNKLCVKLASMAQPLRSDGTPKLDSKNPNPSLRSRSVIGIMLIDGMAPNGPNSWKGRVYNADDGKTYTAYTTLLGDNFLVKGCWGPFCEKTNFKRVK